MTEPTHDPGDADGDASSGIPGELAAGDDAGAAIPEEIPSAARPGSTVRRLAAPVAALLLALAALIAFGVTLSGPGSAKPRTPESAFGGPYPGTATPVPPRTARPSPTPTSRHWPTGARSPSPRATCRGSPPTWIPTPTT